MVMMVMIYDSWEGRRGGHPTSTYLLLYLPQTQNYASSEHTTGSTTCTYLDTQIIKPDQQITTVEHLDRR